MVSRCFNACFRSRPALAAACGMAFGIALAAFPAQGTPPADAAPSGQVELRELRAALAVAQEQVETLRERSETSEQGRRAVAQSLAEALRVAEEQAARARETELQLQALGVDLIARDENALEQRLLKAVRDLDIAQQEIDRRGAVLRRLSESVLNLLKTAEQIPPADRSRAEAALAAANDALADPQSGDTPSTELGDARVVSIDAEVGLVVFDAGRRTGLRVGTPVALLRDERPIFSALVVDVRDGISGAVLQDRLGGESVEVELGDGVRLLPEQNPL